MLRIGREILTGSTGLRSSGGFRNKDDIFEEKPPAVKVYSSCDKVWMALGSMIAFLRIQERVIQNSYERVMPSLIC